MVRLMHPPGLSGGELAESGTVARERRRVSLAARAVTQELAAPIFQQLDALTAQLDAITADLLQRGPHPDDLELVRQRLERLEVLTVCKLDYKLCHRGSRFAQGPVERQHH